MSPQEANSLSKTALWWKIEERRTGQNVWKRGLGKRCGKTSYSQVNQHLLTLWTQGGGEKGLYMSAWLFPTVKVTQSMPWSLNIHIIISFTFDGVNRSVVVEKGRFADSIGKPRGEKGCESYNEFSWWGLATSTWMQRQQPSATEGMNCPNGLWIPLLKIKLDKVMALWFGGSNSCIQVWLQKSMGWFQ